MYNYNAEEKQFLALSIKFRNEIEDIEKQIGKLEERREDLISLLNGEHQIEEDPEEDDNLLTLEGLVSYIERNQGVKRAEIMEDWLPSSSDPKVLTRLLEKGKRRGVLIVEGKSRAAQWYAPEEA